MDDETLRSLEDSPAERPPDSSTGTGHSSIDLDLFRLAMLPGLGPRSLTVLLESFGSAARVLASSKDVLLRVPGVGPKLAHTIGTADDHVDHEGVLQWCQANQVSVFAKSDPSYPSPLGELEDAPPFLFAAGRWNTQDRLSVGIVGTRHATAYGLQMTRRLSMDLSRSGVTIVSGLARGVDTAAHRGALEAGGRTVAFLGGGLAEMYPAENKGLADQIAQNGAVFSEYAPRTKPRSGMFPQRNRLIAAASLATLVIEAPQRSGSLITARLASELGRGVGALPGPANSRASQGCHQLIRDGATLVSNADEVLELLGCFDQAMQRPDSKRSDDARFGDVPESTASSPGTEPTIRDGRELTLNDVERLVLDHVSVSGNSIDEIMQATDLPAARVNAIVSILEMRRFIRRLSSQYVSRR